AGTAGSGLCASVAGPGCGTVCTLQLAATVHIACDVGHHAAGVDIHSAPVGDGRMAMLATAIGGSHARTSRTDGSDPVFRTRGHALFAGAARYRSDGGPFGEGRRLPDAVGVALADGVHGHA